MAGLDRHGQSVVVIDKAAELDDDDHVLLVRGDATDGDVLATLYIVSRANDPGSVSKLAAAGADRACGVVVVAICHADDSFVERSTADTVVRAGDVVIALGTAEQQSVLAGFVGKA